MAAGENLFDAQLFLDDRWVDDSAFVCRRWHQARKYPAPVLVADRPWERWCPVLYGSILHDGERFRMWYCCWTRQPAPRAAYAESRDGVAWEKPALGLCEFEGSRDNNIILESMHGPRGLIDDLTVIHDPDDEEWPLKMLFWDGGAPTREQNGIHAARSRDGIHWDRSPGLVLPGWGDRFNAVSCKVDGKYVLLGRAPLDSGKGRSVWRIESEDLVRWSEPRLVLCRDTEDPPAMQYYSATAFPYEGLLLGSIERMHMSPDRLDCEIVWSRDSGRTWGRARTRPRFIPWGEPESSDDTWINLPTSGPIRHDRRLWFYYSGRSGAHGVTYPLNHGGVGLALLRIDGFASLHAEEWPACVLTPPMTWPQADLYVNADPRRDIEAHPGFACGEVAVEVRGPDNAPIDGFTLADCVPLRHNTANAENACAPIRWADNRSMAALAGREIRLHFKLKDVHLYSFRAGAPVT